MLALCIASDSNGFLKVGEPPKIDSDAISLNANKPLHAIAFPSDSTHLMDRAVLMILFMRGFPKIRPAIVLAILVYMVNLMVRGLAHHVQIRKAVCWPLDLINLDEAITAWSDVARKIARLCSGSPNFRKPKEDSSFWIVGNDFAQALRGKIGLSHDALQMLIGQRPAAIRSRLRASPFYPVAA